MVELYNVWGLQRVVTDQMSKEVAKDLSPVSGQVSRGVRETELDLSLDSIATSSDQCDQI